MPVKIKAVCERIRRNNGIVEVFFTRRQDFADALSQEEHVLINLLCNPDEFKQGSEYWVTIDPAFPH